MKIPRKAALPELTSILISNISVCKSFGQKIFFLRNFNSNHLIWFPQNCSHAGKYFQPNLNEVRWKTETYGFFFSPERLGYSLLFADHAVSICVCAWVDWKYLSLPNDGYDDGKKYPWMSFLMTENSCGTCNSDKTIKKNVCWRFVRLFVLCAVLVSLEHCVFVQSLNPQCGAHVQVK